MSDGIDPSMHPDEARALEIASRQELYDACTATIAGHVRNILRCQELLTLSLAYIPMQDRDLRASIVAALAIRPNG